MEDLVPSGLARTRAPVMICISVFSSLDKARAWFLLSSHPALFGRVLYNCCHPAIYLLEPCDSDRAINFLQPHDQLYS
jgi:hypothetical protein